MIRAAVVVTGLAGLWAVPARAAENAMQVCGAKYQAAKKSNQLPAGQTWVQFLSACRAGLAAPTKQAGTRPTTAKGSSAGQLAARDRQKKCGEQWRADKAAGKLPAGQTWPKYYSACAARLKG